MHIGGEAGGGKGSHFRLSRNSNGLPLIILTSTHDDELLSGTSVPHPNEEMRISKEALFKGVRTKSVPRSIAKSTENPYFLVCSPSQIVVWGDRIRLQKGLDSSTNVASQKSRTFTGKTRMKT
jgi:hypothetical protein